MQETKENFYWVPDNVIQDGMFLNIRLRKWIEGAVSALTVAVIISSIPFVLRVKIIFLISFCTAAVIVNLIGIKSLSIGETIENFIRLKKNGKKYHLRSIDHAKEKFNSTNISTAANESAASKIIRITKEKYKKFIEEDE